jgi:hypothetical protein
MTNPSHLDERSIFSYPPPSYNPSAKEIAEKSGDTAISTHEKAIDISNIIECPTEIRCTLPEGLKVENRPTKDGKANWGVYATKFFPKHSILFVVPCMGFIRSTDAEFKLIIDPEGKACFPIIFN